MRTDSQKQMKWAMAAVSAGCLCLATSCIDLTAETVAGLLSSVSDQLISNTVFEVLGLSGGIFGLLG